MNIEVKNNNESGSWERITIGKFKNGDRIKFMNFTVKASEKSDLTKLVMELLITMAEKKGYTTYFDSKAADPLAKIENV